ncbi:MAG: hypothetical protein GY826_19210 [Fuerstiella sp.]|nr:hypothetical protein [Fuerstiella sp.]
MSRKWRVTCAEIVRIESASWADRHSMTLRYLPAAGGFEWPQGMRGVSPAGRRNDDITAASYVG